MAEPLMARVNSLEHWAWCLAQSKEAGMARAEGGKEGAEMGMFKAGQRKSEEASLAGGEGERRGWKDRLRPGMEP
jgi:hypothetical protein